MFEASDRKKNVYDSAEKSQVVAVLFLFSPSSRAGDGIHFAWKILLRDLVFFSFLAKNHKSDPKFLGLLCIYLP